MKNNVSFHAVIPLRMPWLVSGDTSGDDELLQLVLNRFSPFQAEKSGWCIRSSTATASSYFSDKQSVGRRLDRQTFIDCHADVGFGDFEVESIRIFFASFGYATIEFEIKSRKFSSIHDMIDQLPALQSLSGRIHSSILRKYKAALEDDFGREIENSVHRYRNELINLGVILIGRPYPTSNFEISPDYLDYIIYHGKTAPDISEVTAPFLNKIGEGSARANIGRCDDASWIGAVSASLFITRSQAGCDMVAEVSAKAIIAWCIIYQIESDSKLSVWRSLRQSGWNASDLAEAVFAQKLGRLVLFDVSPGRAATWSATNSLYSDLWNSWSMAEGVHNAENALDFSIQLQREEADRSRARFEFAASLIVFLITVFTAIGLVLQVVEFGYSESPPSNLARVITLSGSALVAMAAAAFAVLKGVRWLR